MSVVRLKANHGSLTPQPSLPPLQPLPNASEDVIETAIPPHADRWVLVYYVFICVSDTYGKKMSHLGWRSHWGPVLYTNAIGEVWWDLRGYVVGSGRTHSDPLGSAGRKP